MIAVTGYNTTIVKHLMGYDLVERINCDLRDLQDVRIPETDRFVLAAGILPQKKLKDHTKNELIDVFSINAYGTMQLCERILEQNENARICIVGSESGLKGSYNEAYAASKAAIHFYVETRKVGRNQQLVAIAPHIISDSGMTERRNDYDACMGREKDQPRGRYITAHEVAANIWHLITAPAAAWINNAVVRMNGGVA